MAKLHWTHQNSTTGKKEANPLGIYFRKVGILDAETYLLLPLRESGCQGVSSWSYSTLLDTGTLARECPKPSYWPQWVCFYVHLGYRSLSVHFWISNRREFLHKCCWISAFVRGKQGTELPTPSAYLHLLWMLIFCSSIFSASENSYSFLSFPLFSDTVAQETNRLLFLLRDC